MRLKGNQVDLTTHGSGRHIVATGWLWEHTVEEITNYGLNIETPNIMTYDHSMIYE